MISLTQREKNGTKGEMYGKSNVKTYIAILK